MPELVISLVFFFNDTATTEIYTLSLHDALPISGFPFWIPGQHRLYIQTPPLEPFYLSFLSPATPTVQERGQLCLLPETKTRKCPIPSDFSNTSPSPSFLRPVCLPPCRPIRSAGAAVEQQYRVIASGDRKSVGEGK